MGFEPYKAEKDNWMHENDGLKEYIAVYVDGILLAAKEPKEITTALEDQYKFKVKGVGPLEYHMGCDYFGDEDRTPCFGLRSISTR
jgi:hypothetical protein